MSGQRGRQLCKLSLEQMGECNCERTCISDGLHLVDIKVIDDGIETSVEIIQQVNHLQWCTVTSNPGEPHNVTGDKGKGEYMV